MKIALPVVLMADEVRVVETNCFYGANNVHSLHVIGRVHDTGHVAHRIASVVLQAIADAGINRRFGGRGRQRAGLGGL